MNEEDGRWKTRDGRGVEYGKKQRVKERFRF